MLLTQLFVDVNSALRGADDDPPTSGADFNNWLSITNRKINELATDTNQSWSTYYSYSRPNEVGTVATTASNATLTGTGTFFTDYRIGDKITVNGETQKTILTITSDTVLTVDVVFASTATARTFAVSQIVTANQRQYSMHRNFLNPSDKIWITKTSGASDYFDFDHPEERDFNYIEPFFAGVNPIKVHLRTDQIATGSAYIGGTLVIPGYYVPSYMTAGTDVVQVPNTSWLAKAVASEIAFGDLTYESKTQSLNDQANALYKQMVRANRRGTHANPRRLTYANSVILDPSTEGSY